MRHLIAVIISIALVVTGILIGCIQSTKPPLRIALNAWPGYEFLFLAQQLGYFQAEGLEVKLISFETLADGRRAFEKHQVDAMGGTLMEFYTAKEVANVQPTIFLVTDFSNGSDMLLANKNIADVAALKGKKLALEVGTVDVLTAANALASAQLTFKDVILTPMPQPNAIQALLAGDIDAVQTYPPFASEALANPNIVRLFDSSQTPGAIVDVLFAHQQSLQERAEDYQRLVHAFYKAMQYQTEHPEDANRRMADREKITPTEFRDGLAGIQMIPSDKQPDYFNKGQLLDILRKTHDAIKSIGAIQGPPCDQQCFSNTAIAPSSP
jgi:NitT/TauT family transport system substrate-binding protein